MGAAVIQVKSGGLVVADIAFPPKAAAERTRSGMICLPCLPGNAGGA
jgi:hypothetical protein